MDKLLEYLPTMRKAIAAALLGAVVSLLSQHGLNPTPEQTNVLQSLIYGLVVGALTWLVPNDVKDK